MLQRFIDRYQLWREEKRRETENKNPLNLLALVALLLLAQDAYTAFTSHHLAWRVAIGSTLLVAFLVLYVRKSWWAWVIIPAFGAIVIIESPLVYVSGSERYSPQVRAISMCLFIIFGAAVIVYGLVMRRRYLSYLEREQRYRAADTPEHLTNRSS
jgi:hypothetical protein